MKKTLLGTNEDGSPHYLYEAENGETLIQTGPIVAVLTVSDGTAYDVTEPYVAVPEEHHDELVLAIGDHYDAHGHADHEADFPFVHDRELTQDVLNERHAARKKAKAE